MRDHFTNLNKEVEELKKDKIQMNLQLQETHAKIDKAYKQGEQKGYDKGWKAYGNSL